VACTRGRRVRRGSFAPYARHSWNRNYIGPSDGESRFSAKRLAGLQRNSQWGIPESSLVPAFVSAASHYLGFVSGLRGLPLEDVEKAGGRINGGKDKSGPSGVSRQNHQNLVKGQSGAITGASPVWLANNFDYGHPSQSAAGHTGGGTESRWTSSLRGIDPTKPTQPAGPQKTSGPLRLVSNQPAPDWPFLPPIFNTR
jgi:hypothetical protein